MQANRAAYEARAVVRRYARHSHLQPPEQAVLDELAPRLAEMRMLDVGVGAGRTALHFAHRVREYVGIDYAGNMVKACRERFPDAPPNVSFVQCDARHMDRFADASFDFVLVSFNALDHVDHDGIMAALDEIRRVCRPGGLLLLSAHNLNSLPRLFAFQWAGLARKPWLSPARLLKWMLLRLLNPPPKRLLRLPCATINDGAHAFRLKTHYIRPAEQIRRLWSVGFGDVTVYPLNGKQVKPRDGLDGLQDFWLYYSCTQRGR
jgi:SAM-dependent methyltransferase